MPRHPFEVIITKPSGERTASLTRAREILIRAPLGAEKARCWIGILSEDDALPIQHGDAVIVIIGGQVRFRGRLHDFRTDTAGRLTAIMAVREPKVTLVDVVDGIFVNMTPTAILSNLINNLHVSALHYTPTHASTRLVDRLEFAQTPLFTAIDLLAKLAGNWLWDIDWTDTLRFRPHEPELPPDHVLYFDDRRHQFRIWETQRFIYNTFHFMGGIANNNAFERFFGDETSAVRFGARPKNIYARPIVTDGAYRLLEDAVLAQLPRPVNEKYLVLHDGRDEIGPGDVVELRGTGMRTLETDSVHRVAEQEIRINNSGEMTVKLTLSQKWESSRRYLSYIDHDYFRDPLTYIRRRVGRFELDWSALDSGAAVE